jgi:hypothetical protein
MHRVFPVRYEMNFETTIGTSVTNLIKFFGQIPFLSKLSIDETFVIKSDKSVPDILLQFCINIQAVNVKDN